MVETEPREMVWAGARELEVTSSLYLTRAEAGRYLNLPPSWLANNTKSGPRYIKVGGHVRYSVASLETFMSGHEVRPR